MRIELERVRYMPKELKPGILYVSEEFKTAAHLCACGCGVKIRTPLGPTEWSFQDSEAGPSLSPSIGNWQQPCRSHYWIQRGEIHWAGDMTAEQVQAGWQAEGARRAAYFEARYREREGAVSRLWRRFWTWLKSLFS